MSSEPVINLEELLAPIPGEVPAGENLLYSGLHDQLKEARRAEDDLPQGAWQKETKTSDWSLVERLALEALASKTKDLQVSGMLVEALIRLHGLPGLRDGLRLTQGLLEGFWDSVYPEIDDGDFEARGNAIAFMERYAAQAVREVPITHNPVGANYSFMEYEEAKRMDIPEDSSGMSAEDLAVLNERRELAESEGRVTPERWRVSFGASNRAYYEETFALLNECWEAVKSLDQVIDEKFGNQTPGIRELQKSIDVVRTFVEKLVKEKRILEPDPVADAELAEAAGEGGPAARPGIAGPIKTRTDALHRLEEVSNFFRQTEPHSPVSYLVQRAIRWGKMPLDIWLEDVIKDVNTLAHLRETLGIGPSSEGSG